MGKRKAVEDSPANLSNPWETHKPPLALELQPLTEISAKALATADYWYFDEAVFILSGWFPPFWAFSVGMFIDDYRDPISQMSLRFYPRPPEGVNLPSDVWAIAYLYYLSWLESQSVEVQLRERERTKATRAAMGPDEKYVPGLLFYPERQAPKAWINWANERLGESMPSVLRKQIKSESPTERRARLARLRSTMSSVEIAKLEGISAQRVRQILEKGESKRNSENASPLRIDQLIAQKKVRR